MWCSVEVEYQTPALGSLTPSDLVGYSYSAALVGLKGHGHCWDQCPSWPHLDQAPGVVWVP